MNHVDISKQEFSFFGKGSKMNGTFHFNGTTHLSSNIEGNIILKKGSDLFIETNGYINGNIQAENVEIFGQFKGELNCSGKLTIHSTAHVEGKIETQLLEIKSGATVQIDADTLD